MAAPQTITGQTLINWGIKPGPWFKAAIAAADKLARENHFKGTAHTEADMIAAAMAHVPAPKVALPAQDPASIPIHFNLDCETDFEKENFAKVRENVLGIATTPIVRAIAVMPDACPQGGGGIPVGTAAVAENAIVPGWHSADICCSVAMSVFPAGTNEKAVLDAGMKLSHFGKGGRPYSHDMQVSQDLLDAFEGNPFLSGKSGMASKHFGTQGDGNHFFYVGFLSSTGQVALVTHHGSRAPGAALYKLGVQAAVEQNGHHGFHKENTWLDFDSEEGRTYWDALQLIRRWTKGNHFAIHDAVAKFVGAQVKDRHWNEHNFVFKREFEGKNYFVHAKGATPNYAYFAPDSNGKTLIPLNMASPILIGRVHDDPNHGMDFLSPSLGFAPHGAGRNLSRTAFSEFIKGRAKEMIADVTSRYDVRAFSGKHDISEFPAAYKDASQIEAQIRRYGLTDIVDYVLPYGCIMAGHDGTDWRSLKAAKKAKREAQK